MRFEISMWMFFWVIGNCLSKRWLCCWRGARYSLELEFLHGFRETGFEGGVDGLSGCELGEGWGSEALAEFDHCVDQGQLYQGGILEGEGFDHGLPDLRTCRVFAESVGGGQSHIDARVSAQGVDEGTYCDGCGCGPERLGLFL